MIVATAKTETGIEIGELTRRLGEAEQRSRSLLAVIGAMVRTSGEMSGIDDLYLAHLEGRLSAIARAQGTMMGRPGGTTDLHGLLADELLAHAAIEDQDFNMHGPDIRVGGRAVGLLWLVVHELAVNSVKFGALSARNGMISVMWTVEVNGSTRLRLRWVERGVSRTPGERRTGFGTEIIERRLARELGGSGSLEFTPTGLECLISVPVGGEIRVAEPA